MTKNMTEPFLESTVSSLMGEVCLYLHILALKKMLCPLFPNSATASSKPSFQNRFKSCVEGWGQSGCSCNHIYSWHLPQWLSMDSSGTWGIFWPAYCPVVHIPLYKAVSPSHVIQIGSMLFPHLADLVKDTASIKVSPVPVSSQKQNCFPSGSILGRIFQKLQFVAVPFLCLQHGTVS